MCTLVQLQKTDHTIDISRNAIVLFFDWPIFSDLMEQMSIRLLAF